MNLQKKISRHISTVVDYDNTSISFFPQIIKTTDKDIIDTRDKLESVNTFSSTHDSEEDLINSISTCTNTQQTFSNTDSNSDQSEEVITERYFQVSTRDYERTENDKISLRKISEDFYNFNFILKDTLISWSFNRIIEPNLFLEISSTSIKATDFIFAESVFNFSVKSLQWKRYTYFIPIFHTVDFITPNSTRYFKISAFTNKYGINQILDVYICRSKRGGRQELRLKCPRIHDYKQLFKNLLETKFPIHPFPVSKKQKIIQFTFLDHDLVKKDININEYIKNVTQNPLNIEINPIKEYKFGCDSRSDRKNSNRKPEICWKSGLKLVYDIYETFRINIKQIFKIIDDNSKTLNFKKVTINDLLDQIIQKIKINCNIHYPKKINGDNIRELEIMSFYAFLTNEVQNVLEWWNKYIFVIEEVQYIPNYI